MFWGSSRSTFHAAWFIFADMSTAEIIEELSKLSADERHEVRVKLAQMDGGEWMDADDPLSDADKALLEERIADMENHPDKSIPWEDAEARLVKRNP